MITTLVTQLAMQAASHKAVDYAGDKLKDVVEDFLKDQIVLRLSKRRQDAFIDQFCRAVQKAGDDATVSAELIDLLKKLGEDDMLAEGLFEAYRKVAFSASKEIGPRVIALIAAKILAEGREPDEQENSLFAVAESFNDADFRQFNSWMSLLQKSDRYLALAARLCERHAGKAGEAHAQAQRFVKIELIEAEWKSLRNGGPVVNKLSLKRGYDANPADLYSTLGPFAPKLAMYGLLHEQIEVGNSKRDKTRRERFLNIAFACAELNELINVAMRSVPAADASF